MNPLFTPEEIQFQVKLLAKKISDKHRGDGTPVIMIGLLNGAFMFYSDLIRIKSTSTSTSIFLLADSNGL